MHTTIRRSGILALTLGLGLSVSACGADDVESGSTVTVTADSTGDDVVTDSIVGLEVTVVGNVSDVLSDEAVRVDRDGLGTAEDTAEALDDSDYGYYDYDFYDYDDLTENDGDFDDEEAADTGVLVVSADGLQETTMDQAVRVSGTVRQFDQDTIESLYDINLADDTFDDYEDALVIVADSVRPAESGGSSSSASPSASASPSES